MGKGRRLQRQSHTSRAGEGMSKTFARAASFPLCWPKGFPEHKQRKQSQFKTTLYQALDNVQSELALLAKDSGKKLDNIVISSNYSLTETKPANPGVAVWFNWDGSESCIPVDRYALVEDNLQAIYHCIKADRTKLRHGGYNMVKAQYNRIALPSPETVGVTNWRDVIGYAGSSLQEAKKCYQRKLKNAHPDGGGSVEAFNELQSAWRQAQDEFTQATEAKS